MGEELDYEEITELYREYVMNNYAGRQPIAIARGSGMYVWDTEGREYLDFLAGIAVNGLGHCHPRVVSAICEQARILMHISNLYYNDLQPKLAKMLVDWSEFDKVFFCNSGTEANEAAIKLARKWGKCISEDKYEVITALGSFHGRTMGSVSATGQPKYQQAFAPLVPGFKHVPFNDVSALSGAVTEKTCAILLEPIQGESGVKPATQDYLKAARDLCDSVGALLIFDEVQTGLGRTGRLFAYEHYGVVPDVMTLAKTLGGGFPIGACLARGAAADVLQPGDHAATFGGNPLACAASIAALSAIHEEGLVENSRSVGEYFQGKLRKIREEVENPKIIDVRGKGLMVAVEFDSPSAKAVQMKSLEGGLLINSIGDTIIRFLPPLIVTKEDVDRAVDIFSNAMLAVGRSVTEG